MTSMVNGSGGLLKVRLWGTRGSLAAPGTDTSRYGGNTSCAEVRGDAGTVLVLDAGTGIRDLGLSIAPTTRRVDILLTHLHMDHIQGLGFFAPLYNPNIEVHIWGPARSAESLRALLTKYLSPPLFPVHFRDMPTAILHKVPVAQANIGEFVVDAALVCHPGPTVGYKITCGDVSMAYIPDHEPELRVRSEAHYKATGLRELTLLQASTCSSMMPNIRTTNTIREWVGDIARSGRRFSSPLKPGSSILCPSTTTPHTLMSTLMG